MLSRGVFESQHDGHGSDAAKVMSGVHSTADHLEDVTITVGGLISNVGLVYKCYEG
jgi:hypothetical protein